MRRRVVDLVAREIDHFHLGGFFRLNDDFRNHEDADQQRHQRHAGFQLVDAHGHLELAGDGILADQRYDGAEQGRDDAFDNTVTDHRSDHDKGHQIDGEILGRAELACEGGNPDGTENQDDLAEIVAVSRGDGGGLQRLAGASRARHRIAVLHRRGGCRGARRVEQDGGDRPAIASRLADHIKEGKAGKAANLVIIGDQDRQHHGDGRRSRQAGQRAEHDADECGEDNEPDGIVIAEKGDEAAKNIFKHDGPMPPRSSW